MSRRQRSALQILVCAFALAAGAGFARLSEPPPPPHPGPSLAKVNTTPLPSPGSHGALVARVRTASPRSPRTFSHEASSLRPFASSLRGGQVITGGTSHRLLLFTFDDGPDVRTTPRLLDILDRLQIRAVFFLTANRIDGNAPWQRENQEIAREIVRRGHIVANHTLDHEQLPLLNDREVLHQVQGTDRVFQRVLGGHSPLIRPPGGARSGRTDRLLAAHGYTQVLWNIGTGDFQVREPGEVLRTFRRVLTRREREAGERGGIVLMHDTHPWTVDAVPLIVDWLRQENCRLLRQNEELYEIVADPSLFHLPRVEQSASTEVPPVRLSPQQLEMRQRRVREEARHRCERLAAR